MGFTIEDMLVVSQDRYKMKMVAGTGCDDRSRISERRGYAGAGGGIIHT